MTQVCVCWNVEASDSSVCFCPLSGCVFGPPPALKTLYKCLKLSTCFSAELKEKDLARNGQSAPKIAGNPPRDDVISNEEEEKESEEEEDGRAPGGRTTNEDRKLDCPGSSAQDEVSVCVCVCRCTGYETCGYFCIMRLPPANVF